MRFVHFEEIDSTNEEAKRRAEAGDLGPLWISAESQTLGKGRRGRDWASLKGNLFCTGLYQHPGDLASAAKLSFVVALAVAETLDAYVDPDIVQIKWPNDVLVNRQKISGILLESGTKDDQLWVVLGVGINLVSHPEKTTGLPATHVLAHIPDDRLNDAEPIFTGAGPVMALLAARFKHWRDVYLETGFDRVRKAWTARAIGMNQAVTARLSDRTIEGTARGLDEEGALILELLNGQVEKIHAGDVFFSQTAL